MECACVCVCTCVLGGAAGGAAGCTSLCVRDRERGHRQESSDEVTASHLPEHEAQASVGGPQPEGRDQRRALRHHQPRHQGVERR